MTKTKKRQVIENLTELVAKVQQAYFTGKMEWHPLLVHEHMDDTKGISIDLYHFGGDGLPVCEGLKPCKLTVDGEEEYGEVFCMTFDPEWKPSKLKFLVTPETDEPDYEVDADALPEEALENVCSWLEGEMKKDWAPFGDNLLFIVHELCIDDYETRWEDYHAYKWKSNALQKLQDIKTQDMMPIVEEEGFEIHEDSPTHFEAGYEGEYSKGCVCVKVITTPLLDGDIKY